MCMVKLLLLSSFTAAAELNHLFSSNSTVYIEGGVSVSHFGQVNEFLAGPKEANLCSTAAQLIILSLPSTRGR